MGRPLSEMDRAVEWLVRECGRGGVSIGERTVVDAEGTECIRYELKGMARVNERRVDNALAFNGSWGTGYHGTSCVTATCGEAMASTAVWALCGHCPQMVGVVRRPAEASEWVGKESFRWVS